MRKPNDWTVAKLRRLAEMKAAGAVGSDIARELGKTVTQVHNKWMYIQSRGLDHAIARASDYGAVIDPPSNGRSGHSIPFMDVDVQEPQLVFSKDQLHLAINFVSSVGNVDQSITLLRRLSEIAV